MRPENKKLFLCDGCGGDHAIGVAMYPEMDMDMDEIYIEWWATSGGENFTLWSRIKAAFKMLKQGEFCTHDVIIYHDKAEQLAEHIAKCAAVSKKIFEDRQSKNNSDPVLNDMRKSGATLEEMYKHIKENEK